MNFVQKLGENENFSLSPAVLVIIYMWSVTISIFLLSVNNILIFDLLPQIRADTVKQKSVIAWDSDENLRRPKKLNSGNK